MLWMFVNTFTANEKYSPLNRDNFTQPIEIQWSEKPKTFADFFLHVWNLYYILKIFKKKLSLIANVFWKLWVLKETLRLVSKKCCLTLPFDKQHGKGAPTHFKSSLRHLYHTYWWPIRILCLKKSFLVIRKMLWLFVNTFTANDKYPPLHRYNFTQPIQIQSSQRRKSFSKFFSKLLKCGLNLNSFKKSWPS